MSGSLSRFAALVLVLLTPGVAAGVEPPPPGGCHAGAWALSDGTRLVVQPSDAPNLRWRRLDGTSGKLFSTGVEGAYAGGEGWSVREPVTTRATFGACGEGRMTFARDGAPPVEGRRIALPTTPVRFASGGETLYGELVMPQSGTPKAVVVLQYGSGGDSAVAHNYVQHLLPLKDIAVFVFDKRGTGGSTGKLSGNFDVLADDMAAAVGAIRARPELAGVPLGLMGESQGGWVAPLAATRAKVDFVVASYGLAVSIIEEDRSEVERSLAAYGPAVQAQGAALHDAATRVFASGMAEGVDDLERLKAASAGAPWRAGLGGDYTSALAGVPRERLVDLKPFVDLDFQLAYDPLPTLKRLDTPMLWVLAGRDTEAPSAATLAILRDLQANGAPIDVAVFPNADHGIIQTDGAGKDLGRTAPGYFELLGDWIATRRLDGPHGEAVQLKRR